jgi:hypothetical protein
MKLLLNELELNIYTLNYMAEDFGHLVDVALEKIVETVEKLKSENYELALKLSQVYVNEDFWKQKQEWAYKNYLETLNEN